jgi:26S proteasome regulatory subunit (ATPase 3-interacting protein)
LLILLKDSADAFSPEELIALDATLASLREKTLQLTATSKILRSTLSNLNSELSTADLVSNISTLDKEKSEIMARLEVLREGKAKKVTKEQREEVEGEWKVAKRVAKRRERIAKEMWGYIADQVQEKEEREELREKLGLDE